jgi:hypothetical protein
MISRPKMHFYAPVGDAFLTCFFLNWTVNVARPNLKQLFGGVFAGPVEIIED